MRILVKNLDRERRRNEKLQARFAGVSDADLQAMRHSREGLAEVLLFGSSVLFACMVVSLFTVSDPGLWWVKAACIVATVTAFAFFCLMAENPYRDEDIRRCRERIAELTSRRPSEQPWVWQGAKRRDIGDER